VASVRTAAVRASDVVLAHRDHVAVARSSFELPEGALVACIGPNGSGKSSLLDAVAGLLRPRSGDLEVLGRPPGAAPVAYVFQSTEAPAQLPLTVREVVTMGRYRERGPFRPLDRRGRRLVDEALARVDAADLADRQLRELSGGQRQRALVAQGLAAAAPLLLLDEPMTGLDVVSRARILAVMNAERDRGATVVFSTHDLSEAADADAVVLLAGRVVAVGPPGEVLTEANLLRAYRGRVLDVGGLRIIDDPHHHGGREDRHDGHEH
jgi:manganese transport system ATP-binding protein